MNHINKMRFGLTAGLMSQFLLISPGAVQAQSEDWFGLPLPGPATDAEIVKTEDDLPHLPSPFAGTVPEFDGDRAYRTIVDIVNFSYEDRDSGNPFWGRMSGSPSFLRTMDYIEGEFESRDIPVERHTVPYYGPDRLPVNFHANVLLLDEQGNELGNLPLQSALSVRYRPLVGPDGEVELGSRRMPAKAEIVPIGQGSLADISTRDLEGKIAMATIPGEPNIAYSDYGRIPARVAEAGAAGLILTWNTPGNMQIALANCMDMPCINLGGRDGAFLRALITRAAQADTPHSVVMDMSVETETRDDKTTDILVSKIAGRDSSHNIVVTAHADAYLTGANDNASGVAILLALADYYNSHQPNYDIYFSVSPGHHTDTQGINPFLDLHPGIPEDNILGINIEHVAQTGIVRSQRSLIVPNFKRNYDDSFIEFIYSNADSHLREVQLSHADNPKILRLVKDVITRHRMIVPARVAKSTFQTEIGPVAHQGGITLQPVEVSPVYHSTGDIAETVAPEILEAQALFYRDMIEEFSKHRKSDLLE